MSPAACSELERRLIDCYQRGLPLVPRPWAEIANELGVEEVDVLAALERLQRDAIVSRVGAVVRPRAIGASTLAAMVVPPERLDEVAAMVSARPEVNHNYEREHRINLWFVLAASDHDAVERAIRAIEQATGIAVIVLPLVDEYRIDLGFELSWT
ncbi:MAG: Lrp/AsnC family transcriptional regulator [Alphaproteobacteria bacterium]|nr:Lrp/AsnC family transcriptional regulator [Alphaproteobacteria bacterium]